MSGPSLVALAWFEIEVGAPTAATGADGRLRRMIPIEGGTVRFASGRTGVVRPGGADWQLTDGRFTELEARYVVDLDGGGVLLVENSGVRDAPPDVAERLLRDEPVDPHLVYCRTTARLSSDDPELAVLARRIVVGDVRRRPRTVEIDFYRLT